MTTRDDYVKIDIFYPNEAIAAVIYERSFFLKQLLKDRGHFSEQLIERKILQSRK